MSYSGRCVQTLAAITSDHRCPACRLEGQLQRLRDELQLVSRERNELADKLRAAGVRAVRAEEERDIYRGRAERAIEQKERVLDSVATETLFAYPTAHCAECARPFPNADWLSRDGLCGKCFSRTMATTEAA